MAQRNRFFKVTKGFNAEVMVAKAVAYTTDATYADFVANSVSGEIGVFNADTLALVDASAALAVPGVPTANISTTGGTLNNVHYFFKITAINANGETTGSTELDVNVTDAGDTNSIGLTWPEVSGATKYRVYWGLVTATQDKYYEVQDNSFEFVTAAGTSGTVPVANTALTGSALADGTKIFIAQKRDSDIFKTTTFVKGSTTVKRTAYTAPVKQVTTVTFAGTIGTDFLVGDTIGVKVIETTPGSEPFPTITYDYEVKAGDTVTTIATAIKNQIISTTDVRNIDGQAFVTASNSAGVLTITALYFGSSFRVAIPGAGYSIGTVVYTTPFKLGSGYSEQVAAMEVEGQIYDGVTTQYPGDGFAPGDFGAPTTFTVDGTTYNIYHFTPIKDEKSPTPVERHFHYWNAILAVPASGGPHAAINTIFGF